MTDPTLHNILDALVNIHTRLEKIEKKLFHGTETPVDTSADTPSTSRNEEKDTSLYEKILTITVNASDDEYDNLFYRDKETNVLYVTYYNAYKDYDEILQNDAIQKHILIKKGDYSIMHKIINIIDIPEYSEIESFKFPKYIYIGKVTHTELLEDQPSNEEKVWTKYKMRIEVKQTKQIKEEDFNNHYKELLKPSNGTNYKLKTLLSNNIEPLLDPRDTVHMYEPFVWCRKLKN
jgi:hypothetical protein